MLTLNRHNMSVNHLFIITCFVVLSGLEHINNFELTFFLAIDVLYSPDFSEVGSCNAFYGIDTIE